MINPKTHFILKSKGIQDINAYEKISLLGKGNYGQVYLARHRDTDQLFALKRVKKIQQKQQGMCTNVIKQISILRKLKHPNIIKLLNYCTKQDSDYVHIILEFMPTDLQKQLAKRPFDLESTKKIIQGVLQGLKCCHSNYIVHRDLKPSNILLNLQKNQVKIGDFGVATQLQYNPKQNTSKIAALYYRAPQILLGTHNLKFGIDIWAVGCIFAQCLLGNILFKSSVLNNFNQLWTILQIFQVSQGHIMELSLIKNKMKQIKQRKIQQKMPILKKLLNQQGLDLLNRMLSIDPDRRITVQECLDHPFFYQIRDFHDEFTG